MSRVRFLPRAPAETLPHQGFRTPHGHPWVWPSAIHRARQRYASAVRPRPSRHRASPGTPFRTRQKQGSGALIADCMPANCDKDDDSNPTLAWPSIVKQFATLLSQVGRLRPTRDRPEYVNWLTVTVASLDGSDTSHEPNTKPNTNVRAAQSKLLVLGRTISGKPGPAQIDSSFEPHSRTSDQSPRRRILKCLWSFSPLPHRRPAKSADLDSTRSAYQSARSACEACPRSRWVGTVVQWIFGYLDRSRSSPGIPL